MTEEKENGDNIVAMYITKEMRISLRKTTQMLLSGVF